jgi:hypothetical protein
MRGKIVVGDRCHEFDVDIAEEEWEGRGVIAKGCWFAVGLVASLFAGAATSTEGSTGCGAAPPRGPKLLRRGCNDG